MTPKAGWLPQLECQLGLQGEPELAVRDLSLSKKVFKI